MENSIKELSTADLECVSGGSDESAFSRFVQKVVDNPVSAVCIALAVQGIIIGGAYKFAKWTRKVA